MFFWGLLLDKKKSILFEEQPDISAWLESKPKEVIMSFLSSAWAGKSYNSH
jgi:hypothetical protein